MSNEITKYPLFSFMQPVVSITVNKLVLINSKFTYSNIFELTSDKSS